MSEGCCIERQFHSRLTYKCTVHEYEKKIAGTRTNSVSQRIPYALPYSKGSDLYWQRFGPIGERMWMAPDLFAPPTIKAFLGGKEHAMEAVLEYMKGELLG